MGSLSRISPMLETMISGVYLPACAHCNSYLHQVGVNTGQACGGYTLDFLFTVPQCVEVHDITDTDQSAKTTRLRSVKTLAKNNT